MTSCLRISESVVCIVFDKGSTAPSISSNVVEFLSKQNVLLHLIDDSLTHGFLCKLYSILSFSEDRDENAKPAFNCNYGQSIREDASHGKILFASQSSHLCTE